MRTKGAHSLLKPCKRSKKLLTFDKRHETTYRLWVGITLLIQARCECLQLLDILPWCIWCCPESGQSQCGTGFPWWWPWCCRCVCLRCPVHKPMSFIFMEGRGVNGGVLAYPYTTPLIISKEIWPHQSKCPNNRGVKCCSPDVIKWESWYGDMLALAAHQNISSHWVACTRVYKDPHCFFDFIWISLIKFTIQWKQIRDFN